MNLEMVNDVIVSLHNRANYTYDVVFLHKGDSIQDIILAPIRNFDNRSVYRYSAECSCAVGDLVVVTFYDNDRLMLAFGLVIDSKDIQDDMPLSREDSSNTGMIIGHVDYPTRIREVCAKKEEIQKKKELLQERIRREAEKIALNNLLASNSELAKDVEIFLAENPEAGLLGEGYGNLTSK